MASNGKGNRSRAAANELLALALAAGKTQQEAAAAAGVAPRTVARRLARPAFRRRVAELRSAAVERATGKLADGMAEAADVLRRLLSAKSETVRLGACRAMLELTVKLRESVELEARLAAIEERDKQ